MDGNKDSSRDAVQRFWDRYIFSLGKQGVKPELQRWYVRRAEQYIKHYSHKRLANHTPEDLTQYFTMLGRQNRLQDWQFNQIVDAIQIMFCHIMRPEWCNTFDWSFWRDASKGISPQHATLARESSANTLDQLQQGEDKVLVKNVALQHPKLLERMFVEIRRRDYSIRTEESYVQWVCRFISYCKKKDDWTGSDVITYLEYLAVRRNVAASTQNLALNAIAFFFTHVLERELGELGNFARAQRPKNLPVVMTKEEVSMVLDKMNGVPAIMAGLLYGCGLRLMECVRLRVLVIDFGYEQINIHNGKGKKGRVVPLPNTLKSLLSEHLSKREALHAEDLKAGYGALLSHK